MAGNITSKKDSLKKPNLLNGYSDFMTKKEKILLYIEPELKKKFRMQCFSNDKSMSEVVEEAMKKYLAKYANKE